MTGGDIGPRDDTAQSTCYSFRHQTDKSHQSPHICPFVDMESYMKPTLALYVFVACFLAPMSGTAQQLDPTHVPSMEHPHAPAAFVMQLSPGVALAVDGLPTSAHLRALAHRWQVEEMRYLYPAEAGRRAPALYAQLGLNQVVVVRLPALSSDLRSAI